MVSALRCSIRIAVVRTSRSILVGNMSAVRDLSDIHSHDLKVRFLPPRYKYVRKQLTKNQRVQQELGSLKAVFHSHGKQLVGVCFLNNEP